MYRGKTSKNFYQYVTDFKFLTECQRYTIYVQFIDNHASAAAGVPKKEIDHRFSTVVPLQDQTLGEPLLDQCFAQFNTSEQEVFVRGSSGHIEAHFEADFNDFSTQLVLKIQQKGGYWPMNYFSTIAEMNMPSERIDAMIHFTEPVKAANNSTGEDDPTVLYNLFDKIIDLDSPLRKLVPNAKKYVFSSKN
jgi:hypothetical protein